MRASLLGALLCAGIAVGTVRPPEASVGGSHARHQGAKLGPFTLPAVTTLRGPGVGLVLLSWAFQQRSGRPPTSLSGRAGAARTSPDLLPLRVLAEVASRERLIETIDQFLGRIGPAYTRP